MIINLQPTQIAAMWPTFKTALISANYIPEKFQDVYLNNALVNVLSGKFQCWVIFKYQEDGVTKDVYGVVVTYLEDDIVFGYKTLVIHTLYGFRPLTNDFALDTFNQVRDYAKAAGCNLIRAETAYPRIEELMRLVGMEHEISRYSMSLA